MIMVTRSIAFLSILLHSSFFADGNLDPNDFSALRAIHSKLADLEGSNFFSSWEFNASDPCYFIGVYCKNADNGSIKVFELDLGEQSAGSPGLTGRLDPAIGNLSSLESFTVIPGQIYGALPESLSRLVRLRFLAVAGNYISGEIPASLGQLRALQTLDLSFNQINGNIPPAIGSLPALKNVFLHHNDLSGVVPAFVSTALFRLSLDHNDLSGPLPLNALPPSLHSLSLSRNRLNGTLTGTLSGLSALNFLDLSFNQFTGEIPPEVFSFPITRDLLLNRNNFSGKVVPFSPVRIPTVDLSYNGLYGDISPLFSDVQNFFVSNNRFMGEVPNEFVDGILSGKILILYLQHNFLTGIQINAADPIPANVSLCLVYNCMVPPVATACPLKAGNVKSRPTDQCKQWNDKIESLD
ncbi:unnamed protein product [Cuscuta europaea]|uniref:Leucine-rich repeat-containing N-terminal plant-type domain-containing protein n=1 Tax=Cuscuta europaea TaxID=41803 RepID=A0A9P1EGP2_CUSEU|nr:unnamed protein product [Cuscuta europaea]